MVLACAKMEHARFLSDFSEVLPPVKFCLYFLHFLHRNTWINELRHFLSTKLTDIYNKPHNITVATLGMICTFFHVIVIFSLSAHWPPTEFILARSTFCAQSYSKHAPLALYQDVAPRPQGRCANGKRHVLDGRIRQERHGRSYVRSHREWQVPKVVSAQVAGAQVAAQAQVASQEQVASQTQVTSQTQVAVPIAQNITFETGQAISRCV